MSLSRFSLTAFLLVASMLLPEGSTARPTTVEQLAAITNKLTKTNVGYGAITALYRPRYDRVIDANLTLDNDEVVFVVDLPDGPRIYPQRIMVWHQVVNETVNDRAYAITYSPTSGTLAAYEAHIGNFNLMLDVEGSLFDANTVMIDRNTGSLWLQELGISFDGPMLGRGLPIIPSYWTTWGYAKRIYPHAPVLAAPGGNRPYGRDPYGDYRNPNSYYNNDELVYPLQRVDRRFPRKTPMLCLELNEVGVLAVDVNYVKKKGAVNFFVGTLPLVAVHDPALDVVRIYNRQVLPKPFLFRSQYGKLQDIGTQSLWDAATGAAIEGPLKGASLKPYHGIYSMWFSWASMNPETYFIPGPGEVNSKYLSGDPNIGQTEGLGFTTNQGVPQLNIPEEQRSPTDSVTIPPLPAHDPKRGQATGGLPVSNSDTFYSDPQQTYEEPAISSRARIGASTHIEKQSPGNNSSFSSHGQTSRQVDIR